MELDSWAPRTDEEYLRQLLTQGESDRLDFKRQVDLADTRAKLQFVKDVLAMANNPPGGHLLIGVEDDGSIPAHKTKIHNRKTYDAAALQEMVNAYTECAVRLETQIHEIQEHDVVIVLIHSTDEGLPIPIAKDGSYAGKKGGQQLVFRKGDIFVRDGAANARIRWSHWASILKERDDRLREQARDDVDSMLKKFYGHQNRLALQNVVSIEELELESSLATFQEVVVKHVTSGNNKPLVRFMLKLRTSLVAEDSIEALTHALDRLTVIGCESAVTENEEVESASIETFQKIFDEISVRQKAPMQLELLKRVYIFGSLLIRLGRFSSVHRIIAHDKQREPEQYANTWIGHIQSEAGLRDFEGRGLSNQPINTALNLARRRPEFVPDLSPAAYDSNDLDEKDPLLNSLCQFSFVQAWVANVAKKSIWEGFSDAFICRSERTQGIYFLVFRDEKTREDLFPGSDLSEVVSAFCGVYSQVDKNARKLNAIWGGIMPEDIVQLLRRYCER